MYDSLTIAKLHEDRKNMKNDDKAIHKHCFHRLCMAFFRTRAFSWSKSRAGWPQVNGVAAANVLAAGAGMCAGAEVGAGAGACEGAEACVGAEVRGCRGVCRCRGVRRGGVCAGAGACEGAGCAQVPGRVQVQRCAQVKSAQGYFLLLLLEAGAPLYYNGGRFLC